MVPVAMNNLPDFSEITRRMAETVMDQVELRSDGLFIGKGKLMLLDGDLSQVATVVLDVDFPQEKLPTVDYLLSATKEYYVRFKAHQINSVAEFQISGSQLLEPDEEDE